MKVLILHPDLRDTGGVASYYRKLEGKFSIPVGRLIIGTRPGEVGLPAMLIRLLRDVSRFIRALSKEHYTIVHVNPSLDPKSLLRDGLFVLLAKLWCKKTLVFIRGWNVHYESRIHARWRWLFQSVFGRADALIVLSEAFKRRLTEWVGDTPVYREYTVLDDEALLGFDFPSALEARLRTRPWRIVFISRLIKGKGLYRTLTAIELLSRQRSDIELVVAGEGPELLPARKAAAEAGLTNVRFVGYVRGKEKTQLMKSAHILCFPTAHGEGMPNAIVECMGFGLPVITRPEGGVADFFHNGVHGYATWSMEPRVYAELIDGLIEDKALYRTMALNNYKFAQTHFRACMAALRLETIYTAMATASKAMDQRIADVR